MPVKCELPFWQELPHPNILFLYPFGTILFINSILWAWKQKVHYSASGKTLTQRDNTSQVRDSITVSSPGNLELTINRVWESPSKVCIEYYFLGVRENRPPVLTPQRDITRSAVIREGESRLSSADYQGALPPRDARTIAPSSSDSFISEFT